MLKTNFTKIFQISLILVNEKQQKKWNVQFFLIVKTDSKHFSVH